MMRLSTRQAGILVCIVIGVAGLLINLKIVGANPIYEGVDYNQFYSASRLAGTGHLYEWDALQKLEAENGYLVPTGRLPVVLYGHKILSVFPFPVARILWMALSLAALLVTVLTWPGANRPLLAAAFACATPITLAVFFGQDIPFWLMFFSLGLLLLERERPRAAGAAMALCICKFHLALGIPILLIAQKRWKALIAGAVAVAALIGFSFLIEGPEWPLRYRTMATMPIFSTGPKRMPSLRGAAEFLPWPVAAEIGSAAAVAALLWLASRRTSEVGPAGAAVAACGLLLGHHTYVADCSLLIPLAAMTVQDGRAPVWRKAWASVLLTPVPALMLGAVNPSPLTQLLIDGFVVAALISAVHGFGALKFKGHDAAA